MVSQRRLQRAKINFKIWKIGVNSWQNFVRLALGEVDICLVHLHPPTRLDFLLHHPLLCKASLQGGGSHRGNWGSRYGYPWPRSLRP